MLAHLLELAHLHPNHSPHARNNRHKPPPHAHGANHDNNHAVHHAAQADEEAATTADDAVRVTVHVGAAAAGSAAPTEPQPQPHQPYSSESVHSAPAQDGRPCADEVMVSVSLQPVVDAPPDAAFRSPSSSPSASGSLSSVESLCLHPEDDPAHYRSHVAFKTLVAGIGMLVDTYFLSILSIVIVLLSFAHGAQESAADEVLITNALMGGSVVGQLLFGVIADYVGRRRSFIATLSLLIVGAVLSSVVQPHPPLMVYHGLAMTLFVLGVGLGGEYPLSSTVSSEAAKMSHTRGRRIASVFSLKSFGAVLAPGVAAAVARCTTQVNLTWRLALAFGAVPAACMLYYRWDTRESTHFIEAHPGMHMSDRHAHKWRDLKMYWLKLLGCAGSWLIFDVVYYANSFFSSTILSQYYLKPDASDTRAINNFILHISLDTLYLALIALPGYWIATVLIDHVGRRRLQLYSFGLMVVAYAACGATMGWLHHNRGVFFALYGVSFFVAQGANVVTYVLPSELFPTTIRATCHGIAAACGRVGAALGGAVMPLILARASLGVAMYVCAAISALGLLWTLLLTWETLGLPLPISHEFARRYSLEGVLLKPPDADTRIDSDEEDEVRAEQQTTASAGDSSTRRNNAIKSEQWNHHRHDSATRTHSQHANSIPNGDPAHAAFDRAGYDIDVQDEGKQAEQVETA